MVLAEMTPPGIVATHFAHDEAPASRDRSFLITPTDELTGLPLPIIPPDAPVESDWHHHFHPKKSPVLKQSDGGKALRNARLQRVDYLTHHNGYHSNYEGPPLPESDAGKCALVLMSVAGYMPEFGLRFNAQGEPRIARLTEEMRHRLQTSGEVRVGSLDVIRKFLRGHILSQGIETINVNELTIEEFLTTENIERRRLLGHNLLGQLAIVATQSADEMYYQARRRELLRPGVASSIERFTKTVLGPVKMREGMVKDLHRTLTAA